MKNKILISGVLIILSGCSGPMISFDAYLEEPFVYLSKDAINDEANASFAYVEDGEKYIHCAIVIISTGSLSDNVTTFVGLDKIGFKERKLPMPPMAKAIVHNPRIIGYVDSPAPIGPKATI